MGGKATGSDWREDTAFCFVFQPYEQSIIIKVRYFKVKGRLRCKLDELSGSNPNLGVTAAAFDLPLICKLKHRTGAYCLPLTKYHTHDLVWYWRFHQEVEKKGSNF